MNERSYLLDIAGLILCIIMISIVAILVNASSKDNNFKIDNPESNIEAGYSVEES